MKKKRVKKYKKGIVIFFSFVFLFCLNLSIQKCRDMRQRERVFV